MKAIPWSIVVLLITVLGCCTFLVWDGKLVADVLVTLVSAITGGGLIHVGSSSASQAPAPPAP